MSEGESSHGPSMQRSRYVLVSACRNEEAYVAALIECIASQTVQPVRWVIVDDGSTDATAARSAARGRELSCLQIATMPGGRPRSFASRVYALQHGYELVKDLDFDFIGFLDADIRVKPDYYERLMRCFQADDKLGLGGGLVIDQYEDRTEDVRKGSE